MTFSASASARTQDHERGRPRVCRSRQWGSVVWERYQNRRPQMIKRWLAVVAVVVVSGCTSSSPASLPGWPSDRALTADRANRTQAELAVLSGATAVVVRSADLGGKLFRVWT